MNNILYIFLLVLIGLISCQTKKDKSVQYTDQALIETFPVIIDTIDYDKYSFWKSDQETSWLSTAEYCFNYIGPQKDSIFINPYFGLIPPPPTPGQGEKKYNYPKRINVTEKYEIDWFEDREYKYVNTAIIDIKIDTSIVFKKSYPVLIKNTESDTILIGYGDYIPLIMEAKDSIGNWRPIQEQFVYMCGNGVNSVFLPPNYITLTLAPIFNGKYKTDLRLTLGKNHSMIFKGNINYRQFESIFTDDGDYKEEFKREREK